MGKRLNTLGKVWYHHRFPQLVLQHLTICYSKFAFFLGHVFVLGYGAPASRGRLHHLWVKTYPFSRTSLLQWFWSSTMCLFPASLGGFHWGMVHLWETGMEPESSICPSIFSTFSGDVFGKLSWNQGFHPAPTEVTRRGCRHVVGWSPNNFCSSVMFS